MFAWGRSLDGAAIGTNVVEEVSTINVVGCEVSVGSMEVVIAKFPCTAEVEDEVVRVELETDWEVLEDNDVEDGLDLDDVERVEDKLGRAGNVVDEGTIVNGKGVLVDSASSSATLLMFKSTE